MYVSAVQMAPRLVIASMVRKLGIQKRSFAVSMQRKLWAIRSAVFGRSNELEGPRVVALLQLDLRLDPLSRKMDGPLTPPNEWRSP